MPERCYGQSQGDGMAVGAAKEAAALSASRCLSRIVALAI